MTTRPVTTPAIDTPSDAWPSLLALAGSVCTVLIATTAHTHTHTHVALNGNPLRSVTCLAASHSVTCQPIQAMNAFPLIPSYAGHYPIYLPRIDKRLSWPWWLVIYRDGLPVRKQPPIHLIATRPGVEPTTSWSPPSHTRTAQHTRWYCTHQHRCSTPPTKWRFTTVCQLGGQD